MEKQTGLVVAYVDWENIKISLETTYNEKVPTEKVLDAIEKVANELGKLKQCYVFGDWNSWQPDGKEIRRRPRFRTEPVDRVGAKDGSDPVMNNSILAYMLARIYERDKEGIEHILVCSGDWYFGDVIKRGFENDFKMHVCAIKGSVSSELAKRAPVCYLEESLNVVLTPKTAADAPDKSKRHSGNVSKKQTMGNRLPAPVLNPAWTSGAEPTQITQTVVYVRAIHAEEVTVISATFNGMNVLSKVAGSQDGKVWTYVTDKLAVGSINSFKINAQDALGNVTGIKETRFKVVEPAGTIIALSAGWNLISVPDNLKDPMVDIVLAGLDVPLIMTYDPAARWLTATKDPRTGKYLGSLTKIETGKGYFVFANTPQTLKVYTADRVPTDLPSQITLKKGLNLIGYTSLPKVDNLKVTQYLSGARWVNVYSFSPDPAIGYQWAKPSGTIGSATTATSSPAFDVDITGAPVVKLGKGYWLNADTDSVITP